MEEVKPDRYALTRRFIRAAAIVAMLLTLYGVGGDFLRGINVFFMSPPCQRPNEMAIISGFAIPFVLPLSIGLQIAVLSRPKLWMLIPALFIPAALWTIHAASNVWDERLQSQCKVRTLAEAMQYCKANPAYFRSGETYNGFPSLTLIAPGETDASYQCLYWWANRSKGPEIYIDKSVCEHCNRTHPSGHGQRP